VFRAHELRQLTLERGDLIRPVADAVVAEEILALDDPGSVQRASSRPTSIPPGNIGASGRVRAGVPPSRARVRSL